MFLRIDNTEDSLQDAPTASAAEPSPHAAHATPMRLSCRMFVLDADDALYRLPTRRFEQMLQAPRNHPLPRFAASRVRLSDVAVEMIDLRPFRVVWSTFDILVFDDRGCLDAWAYERHQRACAELGLVPPIAEAHSAGTVVDAANRFVVQGGCWSPSPAQLRRIGAAALGRIKCRRL